MMAGSLTIRRLIVGSTVATLLVGCAGGSASTGASSPAGSASPSAVVEPTATAGASGAITFDAFHESFCSAWESLFRAVGNPDIGDGSELTKAMDAAITARDLAAVDRLAAEITGEIEVGRRAVAVATGWMPASPMMVQVDRVFVGFEAMTEAKRAAASLGLEVARDRGQEALQRSGAIDAWFALIRPGVLDATRRAIQTARPAGSPEQCPTVPLGV